MKLLLYLTAAVFFCSGIAHGESLQITGTTMGTYYSVVIDGLSDKKVAEGLQQDIESRLNEISRQMSTWDDDSEITHFNRSTSTDWISVSAEFARVVQEAQRIHKLTRGAIDPSVAPLIDLWGFGKQGPRKIPSDTDIEAALQKIGMQHIEVRLTPPALRKNIPELQINLSAIAKGFGVDQVAELLTAAGYPRFVVDIGGENRAGEKKQNGQPWRIGIESPVKEELFRIIPLVNAAVATSGDYRNYFQVGDKRYAHAIDPRTGRPVENPPASVSVIADSCMTADALATGFMVLGPDEALPLARQNNLSVLFQNVTPDGRVEALATGIFEDEEPAAEPETPSESNSDAEIVPHSRNPQNAWVPYAAAAVIFLIAVAGMSIGALLQNKSIKGSCGGLGSMPGEEFSSVCQLCSVPKDECTNADLRARLQAAEAGSDQRPDTDVRKQGAN